MIPNTEDLVNKLTREHVQFMLLNESNYFSLADEYVTLQKIFVKENILDTISLWFDMIVSPILTILHSIWKLTPPSIFTILSFQKCLNLWKDWFRFQELKKQIQNWIRIVKDIGGPFISSNDPDYHMFVYADGMQRLHGGLVSKKGTKRLK